MYFEVKCSRCGKPIQIDFDPNAVEDDVLRQSLVCMTEALICDDCSKKAEQEENELREAEWQKRLPELYHEAGIPYGFTVMEKAIRQDAAKAIWNHRNENILITGESGAGKTTCVCRVLMRLVQNGANVKYMSFRRLLDNVRNRRMMKPSDDDINQVDLYYDGLFRHDFLVIDEIIGKVKGNEMATETLFDIIDQAYAGRRCALWLVGNVREQSMEMLFGDEAGAVERRLCSFKKILIEPNGVIEK